MPRYKIEIGIWGKDRPSAVVNIFEYYEAVNIDEALTKAEKELKVYKNSPYATEIVAITKDS